MGYPGIYTIRGVMGVCHLLVDAQRDAVLLDTGLVGEPWLIRWRMARLGLEPDAVKAILLTHGHLDHAGNLAWAKAWTGAPIYAHPLEQQHIDGTYPYVGRKHLVRAIWNVPAARCCGSAGLPPSTCRSRMATSCRSGAACASCTCPVIRSAIAASTARRTISCSAATCSRATSSTCICRRASSTARRSSFRRASTRRGGSIRA